MNAFKVGETITAGGGSDYTWSFKVESRTAQFVTLRDLSDGQFYRVKVRVHDDAEWCSPFGPYSMAPVAKAGRRSMKATKRLGLVVMKLIEAAEDLTVAGECFFARWEKRRRRAERRLYWRLTETPPVIQVLLCIEENHLRGLNTSAFQVRDETGLDEDTVRKALRVLSEDGDIRGWQIEMPSGALDVWALAKGTR